MQSKPNSTSSENAKQSSSASEKATRNREKLKEMDGSFMTALARLVLAGDDKLASLVSQVYLALESDPLHPLYEHLDRVQTILVYLCAPNPETRKHMRSDLMQLAADLSPRPNIHTSTSLPNPNTCTNTSVTSSQKRSASCSKLEQPKVTEKRPLKRARAGP